MELDEDASWEHLGESDHGKGGVLGAVSPTRDEMRDTPTLRETRPDVDLGEARIGSICIRAEIGRPSQQSARRVIHVEIRTRGEAFALELRDEPLQLSDERSPLPGVLGLPNPTTECRQKIALVKHGKLLRPRLPRAYFLQIAVVRGDGGVEGLVGLLGRAPDGPQGHGGAYDRGHADGQKQHSDHKAVVSACNTVPDLLFHGG